MNLIRSRGHVLLLFTLTKRMKYDRIKVNWDGVLCPSHNMRKGEIFVKKILVLVDLQNDFVDGALGSSEAVSIIPKCVQKIKEHEDDIYVTLDTHYENYMETSEGAKLPVPHCIKGTYGHELNQEIKNALSGRIYTTVEKGTFGSVVLPQIIEQRYKGEEISFELIGLCTDICVVSNALVLKANFPEVEMSVDASCCAGVTPDKHNAALETMRSCQIEVKE